MEMLGVVIVSYYITGATFATLSFGDDEDAGSILSWTTRTLLWPIKMWTV